MLVMPADHLIADESRFRTAVTSATKVAMEGWR
jgi:mannose-1-phosphate guanylyltransferase